MKHTTTAWCIATSSRRTSCCASSESRKPPIVKILDMGLALLSEAHSSDARTDHHRPDDGDARLHGAGTRRRQQELSISGPISTRSAHRSTNSLCGEAIYHGEKYQTPVQKMMALATEPAPPIQFAPGGNSRWPGRLCISMLAKDPSARYATPGEVAQALEPFCGGANLAALVQRAGLDAPLPKMLLRDKASRIPKRTPA